MTAIGTFRDLNLSPDAPAILKLARLTMGLGEIERAVQHPDGRQETDSTHTLMLAMFACEYAPESWNRATLVRLAWAHDLPEVLCGDVSTLGGLTPEQRAEKDRNERVATHLLVDDILCPWGRAADPHDRALADALRVYEHQKVWAAKWLCIVDKALPMMAHALTACRVPVAHDKTREAMIERHQRKRDELVARVGSFPDDDSAWALFDQARALAEAAWPASDSPRGQLVEDPVP